jgi:hypothetical protein
VPQKPFEALWAKREDAWLRLRTDEHLGVRESCVPVWPDFGGGCLVFGWARGVDLGFCVLRTGFGSKV